MGEAKRRGGGSMQREGKRRGRRTVHSAQSQGSSSSPRSASVMGGEWHPRWYARPQDPSHTTVSRAPPSSSPSLSPWSLQTAQKTSSKSYSSCPHSVHRLSGSFRASLCLDREFRSGSLSGCLLAVARYSQLLDLSCNLHLPPHDAEAGVGEDAVRKEFLSLTFRRCGSLEV